MVTSEEVIALIESAIPGAEISVEDLGGGDHLQVNVVSTSFNNLSLVQQHQLVYNALKDKLANESIHALALKTSSKAS
tara:strand:+ start:221 stop:454 length:234 start_codon:yes stop_codon:yes gene_type:complete